MIDLLRTGISQQYNTNKYLRNYLEKVFREDAPTLSFDAAFLVNDFDAALDCRLKPMCSL